MTWEENNYIPPVKIDIEVGESIGNYKRGKKPKNHIPRGYRERKPTAQKYTIGWSGIQAYFDQCARSEKRS